MNLSLFQKTLGVKKNNKNKAASSNQAAFVVTQVTYEQIIIIVSYEQIII